MCAFPGGLDLLGCRVKGLCGFLGSENVSQDRSVWCLPHISRRKNLIEYIYMLLGNSPGKQEAPNFLSFLKIFFY